MCYLAHSRDVCMTHYNEFDSFFVLSLLDDLNFCTHTIVLQNLIARCNACTQATILNNLSPPIARCNAYCLYSDSIIKIKIKTAKVQIRIA